MNELTKDQKKLQDMLKEKKYQNCLLQHSKTRNYYFVVARVFHSETGEEMLAYVALYGINICLYYNNYLYLHHKI